MTLRAYGSMDGIFVQNHEDFLLPLVGRPRLFRQVETCVVSETSEKVHRRVCVVHYPRDPDQVLWCV